MKNSISSPGLQRDAAFDADHDAWDDSDDFKEQDDDEQRINRALAEMDPEQRQRFNLFRSSNCKFNQKKVKEMMLQHVPKSVTVQNMTVGMAAYASKLFLADLLETAREISGNNAPLTPDLILMAYSELENAGKIPGKGPGIKRPLIR